MKKRLVVLLLVVLLLVSGCGKKEEKVDSNKDKNNDVQVEPKVEEKKLTIIDEDSKSRPYAIIINNLPSAMKVQAGLDQAYMIYEFPIEGGYSRSLALFKDKTTNKIGTIRSARQNYIDYALENDAIFVHWGGNHPAYDVIKETKVTDIDAQSSSKPFFRDNPEKLATEHTGYTSLEKLINYATNTKKYRLTTDVKSPLKYTTDIIDLSKASDAKEAKTVELNYSGSYKLKYVYDENTGRYQRYYNNKEHKDYFNGNKFDTKNIIITLIRTGKVKGYTDTAGTNYTDLYNIGSGSGYYITNGYAREIKWSKESRSAQTKYAYTDGTEVNVNDGNTYINLFDKSKSVSIK